MDKPLVSISCIAYNHESYIRQCLDGFLMQKTTFSFEILIHDDASTDNTTDIIREYERKYPDIIKPIYQKENQYSKGIPISATFNWPRAKGKYIAMCEGDDYWIDPLKLQKQVDFLEKHSDFVLSHTDCNILYQNTGEIVYKGNSSYTNLCPSNVFERILNSDYLIRTASVLVRTEAWKKIYNSDPLVFGSNNFKMGDTPLWLELSRLGNFYYFPEVMVVYRVAKGGACRPRSVKEYYRFQLSIYELRLYYIDKYDVKDKVLCTKIQNLYMKNLFRYRCFDSRYKSMDFINTSFLSGNVLRHNVLMFLFFRVLLTIHYKMNL